MVVILLFSNIAVMEEHKKLTIEILDEVIKNEEGLCNAKPPIGWREIMDIAGKGLRDQISNSKSNKFKYNELTNEVLVNYLNDLTKKIDE